MSQLNEITSTITGSFGGVGGVLMSWLGYLIIALLIIGSIWGVYMLVQYKYPTEIFVARNLGDGKYSIGKIVKTRIRLYKKKGVQKMGFLFKKVTIDPIPDKHILPGNKIKLFKVGDGFIPANIKVGNPEMIIEPIPQDIKFWQMNEIQQAAQDYQDLKSRYAPLVFGVTVVLFVLIFAGITIYFIVKAGGAQTQSVVTAIQGIDLQGMATGFAP